MLKLLTVEETSKVLRVSVPRVYQLASSDILPVVRLGRQIRVSEERLREFLAQGGKPLPNGWRREAKHNGRSAKKTRRR